MVNDGVAVKMIWRVHESIAEIPANEWDACLLDSPDGDEQPFLRHRFLSILEESGSLRADTGWGAKYLTVSDVDGRVQLAVPLFIKQNYFGDFVIEQHWAEVYRQVGGEYYPKLQIGAPFTPVSGSRLLLRRGAPPDLAQSAIKVLADNTRSHNFSGIHATYLLEHDLERFTAAGWLPRYRFQYHWRDRGYRCFDDYLAPMNSDKRSMIRGERRKLAECGLRIETYTGREMQERHWMEFVRLYRENFARKDTRPLLTDRFFHLLGRDMPDCVVMTMAYDGESCVGATLNLRGRTRLYSRSWGGSSDYPFLYFEVTLYRAIEFAIANGLTVIEGGEGGDFKLTRGFDLVKIWSAHRFSHPEMHDAIGKVLTKEHARIDQRMIDLSKQLPWRKTA